MLQLTPYIHLLVSILTASNTIYEQPIIAGSGFGSLQIGISTKKVIEKQLGKGKVEASVWYADCIRIKGKRKRQVKTLNYDSLGLIFEFENERIGNSPVSAIKFESPGSWHTKEGITILRSSRAEVYKAFGTPATEHNCVGYVSYDHQGIRFLFNCRDANKANPSDTLSAIRIEAPFIID